MMRKSKEISFILCLLLLLLLANCGGPPSSGSIPTPRSSQTSNVQPTGSAHTPVVPVPSPRPTETAPTSVPRPTQASPTSIKPVDDPCRVEAGVQPVSPVEVDRGNVNQPRIALTFDAGGPTEPTPRILAVLEKYHLRVTFFLTGQWAQQSPGLVRQIRDAGHEIANHTMHHPDLTTLSKSQICSEIKEADSVIAGITGRTTRPYYRPPNGARDSRVRQIAADLGYRTIYWTIDTIDWDAKTTSQMIIDRVIPHLQNGAIVLMHAGSAVEADTLDRLIPMIEQKGYQIVTVTEVLK